MEFGWWEDGGFCVQMHGSQRRMKMKGAWAPPWTAGKPQRKQRQDYQPTGMHSLEGWTE